jgi:hypothetical protein
VVWYAKCVCVKGPCLLHHNSNLLVLAELSLEATATGTGTPGYP